MAAPACEDQLKPRGRKPKGQAKSAATKAKPKKGVSQVAEVDVTKGSCDESHRGQKRTHMSDEDDADDDGKNSDCGHVPQMEAKMVPDGAPVTLDGLLNKFAKNSEVELPSPDQLRSAQVLYMTPPDWVSCNNVYTAVYKAMLKAVSDVDAAKLRGRLATKMRRKDGIILQDLLGSHVFRAAKPKPRVKRARTDEPGEAAAQPDAEVAQNPSEVPKVNQAEV